MSVSFYYKIIVLFISSATWSHNQNQMLMAWFEQALEGFMTSLTPNYFYYITRPAARERASPTLMKLVSLLYLDNLLFAYNPL